MSIDYTKSYVEPRDYHHVSQKIREFFNKKGFIECFLQGRLSILAACEDVQSITTFNYLNQLFSMTQTNQMWLESVIMKDQTGAPGFFTTTTSYREEKHPVKDRHDMIFPMFEFEAPVDMQGLLELEKELLEHLGFGPKETYVEVNYMDMCEKYGVTEITHIEEKKLCEDYGEVVFLKYFPREEAFWNMLSTDNGLTCKIDVIINGVETIGSAERSCDPEEMRHYFRTISGGEYAATLYRHFGEERVNHELEEYLKLPFSTRSGAGIGITRLIKSMIKLGF